MSKLKMEAEQRRLRALDVVDTTFNYLSVLVSQLSFTHLALITAWILAILATYFILSEVLQFIRNMLEASMSRPSLVQRWIKGNRTRLSTNSCCSDYFTDVVSGATTYNPLINMEHTHCLLIAHYFLATTRCL